MLYSEQSKRLRVYMNKITTLSDSDIFPQKEIIPVAEWKERKTVKILLENSQGELAFVTNPVHGFYLLPGGGVEPDEDIFSAADRECQEEVGYSITKPRVLGSIEEWRARDGVHYDTVCLVATIGLKIESDLRTEEEKKNGLVVRWISVREASSILKDQVTKLRQEGVSFYNTAFNIVRDQIFFEDYIQSINLTLD
jgi:8-oxo-dGTP pyrophosphatase MutT (NUDIX family)